MNRLLRKVRTLPTFALAGLGFVVSCTGTIGAADDSVSPAQSPGPTIPGSAAVDLSATPHLVRLTSTQWLNAARDAFGGSEALSAGLKPLPEGGGHFDTLSSKFVIGEAEFSAMAAAADQLSARVLANSTLLAQLTMGAQGKAAANALIRKVGRRIHRATLTADDVQDYESVYVASLPTVDPGGDAHRFALGQVISSMLQSPNFVYRTEHGDGDSTYAHLKGTELASKLSFALWNTSPDDGLLDAAEKGELDTVSGYTAAVDTMLNDARANAVLVRFHESMLSTSDISTIARNSAQFPKAYNGMGADMAEELRRFVKLVVVDGEEGGNWNGLLKSRTAFVNQNLAKLYDVPLSASSDLNDPSKWARVSLPDGQRAGIPTRAGLLALKSNGINPSSIRRGVFFADSIACVSLKALENKVLPTFDSGSETTNRKRVEAKTKGCGNGCHGNGRDVAGPIGPLGFAFESYDAAGIFRTSDGGEPVDSSGKLEPFGQFSDAIGLLSKVAETEASHGCYAREWASYLLGRKPSAGEEPVVSAAAQKSLTGAKVREMIRTLVLSDLFLARKNDP